MNAKLLPPHYFAISVVLMLVLNVFSPWGNLDFSGSILLGLLFIVAGIGLVLYCRHQFRQAETPTKPKHIPTKLVDSGPFGFSRNPVYLGGLAVLVGVALVLGAVSPWVIVIVFALLIHHAFVLPEEEFLQECLGEEYMEYCKKVRRWI